MTNIRILPHLMHRINPWYANIESNTQNMNIPDPINNPNVFFADTQIPIPCHTINSIIDIYAPTEIISLSKLGFIIRNNQIANPIKGRKGKISQSIPF